MNVILKAKFTIRSAFALRHLTGLPQLPQNFEFGGSGAPQLGQCLIPSAGPPCRPAPPKPEFFGPGEDVGP